MIDLNIGSIFALCTKLILDLILLQMHGDFRTTLRRLVFNLLVGRISVLVDFIVHEGNIIHNGIVFRISFCILFGIFI